MDILRNSLTQEIRQQWQTLYFFQYVSQACSSELEVRDIGSDLLNAYHDYK